MAPLEVTVDGELFCVTERTLPYGALCYDFAWLNGPAEGTYGFTVRKFGSPGEAPATGAAVMTEEELRYEVQRFVEGFHAPGGICEEDFPCHAPAGDRTRREG